MNIAEMNKNLNIAKMGALTNNPNIKNNTNTKTENNSSQKSFSQLLDSIKTMEVSANISKHSGQSGQVNISDPRLPGDILGSFKISNPTPADKKSEAQGMARDYGNSVTNKKTIDKTSKLYEQALELESYFVKIMLSSMRNTLSGKTIFGDQSFAGKMYEDMIYDERARSLTKHSGLGLADQIYLELSH